jgi:DNA-binding transcriptional LysR family regulator
MDIRHFQTFRAIIGAGSFVGAAEKLGYSQSTITMQVQALERELGVELFARSEKKLTLTEGGRLFEDHVERILENLGSMRQAMNDLVSGDAGLVRIAAINPAATRLTGILAGFMGKHPKVKVVLESGGTASVSGRVAQGAVDVGLCAAPPAKLGLVFEPLYVEDQSLLLPADHELAGQEQVRAEDVVCCSRIMLTEPGCQYRETTENGFMQSGLLISPSMQISNLETLKQAVQSGLGVAILPTLIATPPPAGTVLRPLKGVKLGLSVGMVRRSDAPPPGRALKAFMEEMRDQLAA